MTNKILPEVEEIKKFNNQEEADAYQSPEMIKTLEITQYNGEKVTVENYQSLILFVLHKPQDGKQPVMQVFQGEVDDMYSMLLTGKQALYDRLPEDAKLRALLTEMKAMQALEV